jgi:tetratricopeptide (TPR) repeat protein
MEYIRKAPEDYSSYFALGYFFMETGDNLKAISPFEEAVRLKPDYRGSLFNLVALYNDAAISTHDRSFAEKRMTYARVALQLEERHLKLHPDDEGCRQNYALLLFWNGRASDALKVAQELKNARDGKSLFNIAGLFNMLGESDEALTTFRKAIEAGYKNIRLLNAFLMDENEGVARFAGTPEYEEVKRMIEEIQRETEARKNG